MFVEYLLMGSLFIFAIACFIHHETRMKNVVVDESPFYRELAKTESPIEKIMFKALWHQGYNVQTQVKCGRYRIDLCIGKLAIECDGKAYHSSPAQKAHDRRRDAYLRSQGYKVIRVSGRTINRNLNSAVSRVNNEIKKAQSI